MDINEQINSLLDQLISNKPIVETDSVQQFWDEWMVPSDLPDYSNVRTHNDTRVGDFHTAYRKYCEDNDLKIVHLPQIRKNLQDKGHIVTPGQFSRHYIRGWKIRQQKRD